MTQRIKIENLKDGGPYDVTLFVVNKTGKGPDYLASMETLKPGESKEILVHGGQFISVAE